MMGSAVGRAAQTFLSLRVCLCRVWSLGNRGIYEARPNALSAGLKYRIAVGMAAAQTALSVAVGLCVAVYVATALASNERP